MEDLTINWHITEACNFKCSYCFAHWDNKPCKRELLHSPQDVEKLLDQLLTLPSILGNNFRCIRLNLVGGETFLFHRQISHIISQAKSRGMRLSAITNGNKLNAELNQLIAQNLDIIGFSIDSINPDNNLKIGRQENNIPVNIDKIVADISTIRALNPLIQVKINTVVNKLNYLENLGSFIDRVSPEKWKIFQMLPITEHSRGLEVTKEQFALFLNNHSSYSSIISYEDNSAMTHSYLMIDPYGRFFQNDFNQTGYVYSSEILNVNIQDAFKQINFDIDKFMLRYDRAV